MGFLNWWRAAPVEDPLIGVIKQLMDDGRAEREQAQRLLAELAKAQQEQNATARMLLEQYVAKGPNQSTSLDERLFMAEGDEATDWEPVLDDPFSGVGI